MALPKGLTREHIEQAIAQLDTGAPHPFGASTDYDLLVNGKTYPPKAVVGLAASTRHRQRGRTWRFQCR